MTAQATHAIAETLRGVEASLIDWKRRKTKYERNGLRVPAHVTRMIDGLKADARLLRRQMDEKNGERP